MYALTVGERIERIVMDLGELHKATGIEYFMAQASAWAQWVWMLDDKKRREWQLHYRGRADGTPLSDATTGDHMCLPAEEI